MFKNKSLLLNALWWMLTGYPFHFAGITAGTVAAVAAAASAAAGVAGAVGSSSAAKKGAKGQAAAAGQAGQIDQAAVDRANALAKQQYEEDIVRQTNQLAFAQGRLDPYAAGGGAAFNQLSQLTRGAGPAIAARAASGTDDATRAQIQQWRDQAVQAAADNAKNIEVAMQRGAFGEVQRLQAQDEALQRNAQEANKRFNSMTAYDPGQAAQAASANGGDLYRGFNQEDYLNDPTSGANFRPEDFRQSSATGAKLSDAEIKQWLADNPGASDSKIAQAMRQYGVSTQQLARATGMDENDINTRLASARDPNATSSAPNLTKNFDEAGWLAQQGRTAQDMTRNFDQAGFLKQGGHNIGDLTKDFNRTGYLKNAGFTEADLARKFTANDFQVDPGYQFRLSQGTQGIENSAAATGGQLSGATLKALARYNQDFGSNEYGNVFNRFQSTQQQAGNALNNAQNAYNNNRTDLNNNLNNAFNRFGQDRSNLQGQRDTAFNQFGQNRENASNVYNNAANRWTNDRTNTFNRLASLAGVGQQAATQQGQWGMNYAGNTSNASQNYSNIVGQNTIGSGQRQGEYGMQAANAKSSGMIGSANAVNTGMGQVGNALTNYSYLRNSTPIYSTNNQFFGTRPIYK